MRTGHVRLSGDHASIQSPVLFCSLPSIPLSSFEAVLGFYSFIEIDPKERERLVLKFMKVMKFLRKHNNFNSYLAFLSALDSASIRRLDWPKAIVDTIKEYSAIIDFTGSFKAYREALSRSR